MYRLTREYHETGIWGIGQHGLNASFPPIHRELASGMNTIVASYYSVQPAIYLAVTLTRVPTFEDLEGLLGVSEGAWSVDSLGNPLPCWLCISSNPWGSENLIWTLGRDSDSKYSGRLFWSSIFFFVVHGRVYDYYANVASIVQLIDVQCSSFDGQLNSKSCLLPGINLKRPDVLSEHFYDIWREKFDVDIYQCEFLSPFVARPS